MDLEKWSTWVEPKSKLSTTLFSVSLGHWWCNWLGNLQSVLVMLGAELWRTEGQWENCGRTGAGGKGKEIKGESKDFTESRASVKQGETRGKRGERAGRQGEMVELHDTQFRRAGLSWESQEAEYLEPRKRSINWFLKVFLNIHDQGHRSSGLRSTVSI